MMSSLFYVEIDGGLWKRFGARYMYDFLGPMLLDANPQELHDFAWTVSQTLRFLPYDPQQMVFYELYGMGVGKLETQLMEIREIRMFIFIVVHFACKTNVSWWIFRDSCL